MTEAQAIRKLGNKIHELIERLDRVEDRLAHLERNVIAQDLRLDRAVRVFNHHASEVGAELV